MIRSARDWRWSSYRATAGLAKAPDWLAADWVLGNFGLDLPKAQRAYRRFVREGHKAVSPRDSLRGQIWLGGEAFRERMVQRIAGQDLEAVPKDQTRPDRVTPQEVLGAVAVAFGIDREQVLSRSHQAAFRAAVYLLRRACNLSLREVSEMAGVSPSRVSKIQGQIERTEPSGATTTLLDRYQVEH
jgi:hypothetical protein